MTLVLPAGSSGSWVVNPKTFEVYGHVVAENALGDIWVVPMCDILNDIREEEDAISVRLACTADISVLKLGSDEHIDANATRDESPIDTKQTKKANRDHPSIETQQNKKATRDDTSIEAQKNKPTVPELHYKSTGGQSTSKPQWVWYCCSCGDGPDNYNLDKSCPFCYYH